RWEDVRLLEVGLIQNQFRQYILYSADGAFARWIDYLPTGVIGASSLVRTSSHMPDSGSIEEMSRRLREALALVAARTGLAPRTFLDGLSEKPKKEAPQTAPQRRTSGLLPAIAVLIFFALPFAALFLGVLAIPLLTGLYFLIQQPMRV